jgi:hypothetical protein
VATQRYISTSFWDDAWIRTLDPSEKFTYLYLMTNPLTNIAGVYEITIDRICFDTGYNQDTIEKVLKRFEESKKVYRWKTFIALPSWPKHQRWQQRSKIKAGIIAILEDLPEELLKFLKKIGYTYPIDTLSIGYTYLRNYSDTDTDLNSDADTDTKNDTPPNPKPVDNSKPEPDPEEVRAAAAVLNLQLKSGDAAAVSRALFDHSLDAAFITWASGELKANSKIKNPAGFLRKMLLSLDEYGDWIARYRTSHARPSPPARAAPPGEVCPHCGGALRAMGDELWCGICKRLLWEYDADFDIWTEAAEKARSSDW